MSSFLRRMRLTGETSISEKIGETHSDDCFESGLSLVKVLRRMKVVVRIANNKFQQRWHSLVEVSTRR
jgi:hypothetical protein